MILARVKTWLVESNGGNPMMPTARRPHIGLLLPSARVRLVDEALGVVDVWCDSVEQITELDGYFDAIISVTNIEDVIESRAEDLESIR